ncbi:MAG: hypothetical protein PWP24_763 [Clostridiales bacterium]|nr:hypothetical protein [Clostridiales bacterium]
MRHNTKEELYMTTIDHFIEIAPYIPQLFDEPASLAITDRNEFLYVLFTDELNLKLKQGDVIPQESATRTAMNTGKLFTKEMPAHIYGIPFKSIALPIKEKDGTVIGCFVMAKGLERSHMVKNTVTELSDKLDASANEIHEVTTGIHKSSSEVLQITEKMDTLIKQAEKMAEVLAFIQKIAASSKMMGLNASIEAARVGEAGRGFSVVAKEIEKMSLTTKESASNIERTVHDMKETVNVISKDGSEAANLLLEQVEKLNEITQSIAKLNENAKFLKEFSDKL